MVEICTQFLIYTGELAMSILVSSESGWMICHCSFINKVYASVNCDKTQTTFYLNGKLFLIKTPFLKNGQNKIGVDAGVCCSGIPGKRRKRCAHSLGEEKFSGEVEHVQMNAEKIISAGWKLGCLDYVVAKEDWQSNNLDARQFAETFYREESKQLTGNFHGGNISDVPIVASVQAGNYLVPPRCKFFCYDVREMREHIHLLDGAYDFILLDPPWWNKYIRRKKSKCGSAEGYQMMFDEDLARLPVPLLTAPGTLVAVWCTNAESHLSAIRDSLFPAWGVSYVGKWYWLKVTCAGQAVSAYSEPLGKQPFEQIVFGWVRAEGRALPLPEDGRVVVSVPSALHSHKPPLADVVAGYLPPAPRCLELFARYLLPGYTSWGMEVLKLQQICLYQQQHR